MTDFFGRRFARGGRASLVRTILAIGVTAATVVYLARALYATWGEFSGIFDSAYLLVVGWLSVAYGACLFILFGSWYLTLRRNASTCVPVARGAWIYCVANLAKYLPGNVFHFAGRQILGARAGWNHRAIAQATLLEIAATAASVSLLILAITAIEPSGTIEPMLPAVLRPGIDAQRPIALAAFAVFGLAFFALGRLAAFERMFSVPAAATARAVALCAVFFCLNAAIAVILARHLPAGPEGLSALSLGLAYLVAWFVGFIVPGAPGGLGVRESMLVLFLTNADETAGAFALGLGFGMRLVSTLGDVIAVGMAYVLKRMAAKPGPERHNETECVR